MTRRLGFKYRSFSFRSNSHKWHFDREYRFIMSVIYSPRFFASRHDPTELRWIHEDAPDLFLRRIDGYSTCQLHCLPPTRKEATSFPMNELPRSNASTMTLPISYIPALSFDGCVYLNSTIPFYHLLLDGGGQFAELSKSFLFQHSSEQKSQGSKQAHQPSQVVL